MSLFVKEAAKMTIDIKGHKEHVWLYIILDDGAYDLILGLPWIKKNSVKLAPVKKLIWISSLGTRIRD